MFLHAQRSIISFEYVFAGAKLMGLIHNKFNNECFIRVFLYNSMYLLSG